MMNPQNSSRELKEVIGKTTSSATRARSFTPPDLLQAGLSQAHLSPFAHLTRPLPHHAEVLGTGRDSPAENRLLLRAVLSAYWGHAQS